MKPGKALLFGFLGLVAGQLITWWQQSANPLLSIVLTIVAGAIPLLIDYAKDSADQRQTQPRPQTRPETHAGSQPYGWGPPPPPPPPRQRRRGTGPAALLGALVVLVALGGGIAYGATTVTAIVTGNESQVQRLAKPVTGTAGALRVSVEEVGVGDRYTHVRLTAINKAGFTVTIPLFDNCQLVEPGQASMAAKTDFGTSTISVPPGSVPITKTAIFSGTPSTRATSLTLTCSTLFWQGFGQPQSLTVKGIALNAG